MSESTPSPRSSAKREEPQLVPARVDVQSTAAIQFNRLAALHEELAAASKKRALKPVFAVCAVAVLAAGAATFLRQHAPEYAQAVRAAPAPQPEPSPAPVPEPRPDLLGEHPTLRPDLWPARPHPASQPVKPDPRLAPNSARTQSPDPELRPQPRSKFVPAPEGGLRPAAEPETSVGNSSTGWLQMQLAASKSPWLATALSVLGVTSTQTDPEHTPNPFPSNESKPNPSQTPPNAAASTPAPGQTHEPTVASPPSPGAGGGTDNFSKIGGKPKPGTGIAGSVGNRFSRRFARMTGTSAFTLGSIHRIFIFRPPPIPKQPNPTPPPIPFCQHRPAPGESPAPNLPFCDVVGKEQQQQQQNPRNPDNPIASDVSGGDGGGDTGIASSDPSSSQDPDSCSSGTDASGDDGGAGDGAGDGGGDGGGGDGGGGD